MTYRCGATAEAGGRVLAEADLLPCPHPEVEWADHDRLQCLVEDVPHDFHAAFLRSGTRPGPGFSDLYLCWRDGSSEQWLTDAEPCMRRASPLGTGCTVHQGHPGRCDWQYIDPASVAALALACELARHWGIAHLFKPS